MRVGRTGFGIAMAAHASIAGAGCQLFVDSEPGAGIGAPCERDAECQGAQCIEGVCASPCTGPVNCPAPARCMRDGLCQLPLRVGFVYAGDPAVEQWAQAHDLGRLAAEDALPYLETEVAAERLLASDAALAMDDFIDRRFDVIVATSSTMRDVAAGRAADHPGVKFLTCGAPASTQNDVSYHGRMYQATYLAGYAAARRSTSKRLGMIGSYVTPAVVRHINAFATGARRAEPSAVVEVRWIGFWHDTDPPDAQGNTKERALTQALLAAGCDVIAHQADNGVPVTTVAGEGGQAKAIGNNVADACPEGSTSCLGATYWQWGPLYAGLFDELHRWRWPAGQIINPGIQIDPAESVVNFGLNTALGGANLAIEVSDLLAALAGDGGASLPFRGPLCSTGQRDVDGDGAPDCVAGGEAVGDEEMLGMCWFVEGLVEKADPTDPASADIPAIVPASGDCAP
ncbi:MAG: BMP family ABC transporter substrate-binding protein [Polyangiaceae bacterium]|nr:BMP family ABC transporter substrate-binding protein [Polyangiaceae bacterium]